MQAVAGYLDKVGVKTKINAVEFGVFAKVTQTRKIPAAFYAAWGEDFFNPIDELQVAVVTGTTGFSWYSNKTVDRLTAKAASTLSQAKQDALIRQIQQRDLQGPAVHLPVRLQGPVRRLEAAQLEAAQRRADLPLRCVAEVAREAEDARYVLRRLVQAVGVLWLLTVIVFGIARLSGDPVDLMLPQGAPQTQRTQLIHELGLDRPLPVQYWKFVSKAVQGDFGESTRFHAPAMRLVLDRMPATIELALARFALALVIGIPLGSLAALREGRAARPRDHLAASRSARRRPRSGSGSS